MPRGIESQFDISYVMGSTDQGKTRHLQLDEIPGTTLF